MAGLGRRLKQIEFHLWDDQIVELRRLQDIHGMPVASMVRQAIDKGLLEGRRALLPSGLRSQRGKMEKAGCYLRHEQHDVLRHLAGTSNLPVAEIVRRLVDAYLSQGNAVVEAAFDPGAQLEALTAAARVELRAGERRELRRRIAALSIRRPRETSPRPLKASDPVAK